VIEDSVIQEGNFGILLEKVSSVNISEMVFQNLRYGIFASKCSQLKSIHNEYEECDFSIFVQSIDDAIISHCTITKAEYGLYLSSIDDFAVTMNHIEGSKFDGLNLASCTNGNVTHNSIEENQRHGIQLISSDNIRIYDNEIGWNKEENAVDSIGTLPFVPTNLWDDGNSRGNAYSDYSGSGRYKIPGTSGSEDRYPSYILFVASPADMTIEYGEEGYVLWNASALHPDRYHITTNSEVLEGGQWDGGPIQITIPANRYPGEYLYSLHINTTTNRSISDDVHVIIEDTNSPVWVIYPEDQSIEGGERFSYALQASDLSGITEYWVNDTSNFEITNGILRDMHVLSLGDYHLELRAYDAFDNYCFAEIIIAIEDTTPPDISHPPDYEYTLGATGNQIEWTFSDDYPISYEVLQGNDRILEGIWNDTASSLGLNIDGLSIGTHIFTLIIYDAGGNSASDEVTVSVVEDTTTTIETPTSIESSTTQTSTTTDQPDLAFPVLILGTMISTALLAVFILAKREH
ncbi:MAG: right-handed parallel beta-helix repeat-containing protein, partial [Candidatus Thorarchaeota archaeon]|nr:right-handed parallel beta-helix repeat-containing protein [Candidatus Thorarchaeota archaeon]